MKKFDLMRKLDEKGVPPQSYSLDGMKEGECLCVIEEDGVWVVYNSRGRVTDSTECASEDLAYDEIYKQMADAYGWFTNLPKIFSPALCPRNGVLWPRVESFTLESPREPKVSV